MRLQTFFAAASLAASLVSGESSHGQRDLKVDGNPAAARAENDAYWASYLQAVDSFPSAAPSAAPTGECKLDVTLNCTYVSPETGAILPCTDIPFPPDGTNCIIEVVYGITACNEGIDDLNFYDLLFYFDGEITDLLNGENPLIPPGECLELLVTEFIDRCKEGEYVANVTCNGTNPITGLPKPCDDTDEIIIVIPAPPTPAPTIPPTPPPTPAPTGECKLSVDLNCTYISPVTGAVIPCTSLEYTSNQTLCIQEVTYGITACNEGIDELTFYDLLFYFDGDLSDLLNGENPIIPPGECLELLVTEFIDRCKEGQYIANVTCNGTNPITGLPKPCDDTDEIIITITVPPTPAPTPPPTLPPTPPPTLPPTPPPTLPPTPPPTLPPTPPPTLPPTPPPTLPPTPPPTVPPTPPPTESPTIGATEPPPTPPPTLPPTPPPTLPPTPPPTLPPTPPPTLPPTPPPTLPPTPPPTLSPTPAPTPAPTPSSPAPTGECNIDISVAPECPAIPCNFDRCLERPFRMLFRVETRTCDQSILRRCPGIDPDTCSCIRDTTLTSDAWAEQKFFCTDFGSGPPPAGTEGIFYIRAYPSKDPTITYFEGPVTTPGGLFNMTAPATDDRVAADSYLELYSCPDAACASPGTMLQQVLFHSSCSQQLYLFDIFGSFQLVEFESTTFGLISSFTSPSVGFTLTLDATATGSTLVLDFMSIVVLSDNAELLEPQIVNFDVAGTTIPPSLSVAAPVNLFIGQPFQVITTVGGQLDGLGCFDVANSTILCEATVEPTGDGDNGGGGGKNKDSDSDKKNKDKNRRRNERRFFL